MRQYTTEVVRTLVLLAVIGLVVVAAVPRFDHGPRPGATENAVIATLCNLTAAQRQAAATAVCDRDRDGLGEYLGFGELAAANLVSKNWGQVGPDGVVELMGYRFRVWLPAAGGGWVGADRRSAVIEPDLTEQEWRAYAWPKVRGGRTVRVFCVDQSGRVRATRSARARWEGLREPPCDAADQDLGWVVVHE